MIVVFPSSAKGFDEARNSRWSKEASCLEEGLLAGMGGEAKNMAASLVGAGGGAGENPRIGPLSKCLNIHKGLRYR